MKMNLDKKEVVEMVESIGLGVAIACVFSAFVKPVKVVGSSMDSTLHDGQRLFVFRQAYLGKNNPEYKDIIVVDADFFGEEKKIIKRVIATEGQSLKIEGSNVYVDGELLEEDYIKETMEPYKDIEIKELPKDTVFVMGDNRNNSGDSRHIGLINESDIYGKVLIKK